MLLEKSLENSNFLIHLNVQALHFKGMMIHISVFNGSLLKMSI